MSQTTPLIGITTYARNEIGDFALPASYVKAVQAAGGNAVLLPPSQADLARVLGAIDALILSGGGDIDPALYGGSSHPSIYSVDSERDAFELALATQAIALDLPVLGICRGMQILTIATGGTLVEHVPDAYGDRITHRLDNPRRPIEHLVQVVPHTRLASLVGEPEIRVVSWHHQAVKRLPPVWTVMANATDGLIEAIDHQHHPWAIGVQWHPELSPQDPTHQRLFQELVAVARP